MLLLRVRETHQIAQAQQEKNSRLREAFGIPEHFVDGSSFDQERQAAREEEAKAEALRKKVREEKEKEVDNYKNKKYGFVKTPSPEKTIDVDAEPEVKKVSKKSKKDKKKKKSKKHKKEK